MWDAFFVLFFFLLPNGGFFCSWLFAFFIYGIKILICYAVIASNSIFYPVLMSGLYTEGAFLVYSCGDYWVCWKVSLGSMMVSPLTSETYPHAFKSP